jgi:hypothetical protein
MKRFHRPSPGLLLGIIAVVLALGGSAVAGIPPGDPLRLGMFNDSSRDRLAGTGVIQYAAQTHNTGTPSPDVKTFSVQCAAAKKATAGGFKWLDTPPPGPEGYQFVDAYPTGGGYTVRLRVTGPTGANQDLSVFANCVKSRRQDGTPPS